MERRAMVAGECVGVARTLGGFLLVSVTLIRSEYGTSQVVLAKCVRYAMCGVADGIPMLNQGGHCGL